MVSFRRARGARRIRPVHALPVLAALALAGGVPRPAGAAAFLAINGGTWSYSAAEALSPAGVAYFWGLSAGVGSVSYAYAYSFAPGGQAAAYAIARAGFGWRGAWYAAGFADPQADVGLGIPDISSPSTLSALVGAQNSSGLGSEVTAAATAAGSLSGTPYTITYDTNGEIDGVTFNPGNGDSGSETNAYDALALVVVSSAGESDFCTAIGDPSCAGETAQTNAGGDVYTIPGVLADLGGSVLYDEIDSDPANLASGSFTFPDLAGTSSASTVLLLGVGNTVPEPASAGVLAAALAGLAAMARRRRPG